ncbi:Ca2+-transporting ATPase [Methanophagales archaeon]|nr:Ca2+-transporting ATPase [Methanophagales archaeon]
MGEESELQKQENWYQLSVEDVFEALESGTAGLSTNEAKAKLESYGYNELKFKKRSSIIRFIMQFHNPLVYVLLIARSLLHF